MPSVKIPNGSGGWIKIPTVKGDTGKGIVSVIRTSGTGLAGSTDTYTITYSDATTSTYTVVNGTDGNGAGDMVKTTYDTNNDGIVNAADSVPWTGVTDPPSTYTPSSHAHGNITNDGKIGPTADLPVFTTAAGAVTTKTIADAKTLLGIVDGAQIATGSYVGTGTFGSGSKNSLTFSIVPKILIIQQRYVTPNSSNQGNVFDYRKTGALIQYTALVNAYVNSQAYGVQFAINQTFNNNTDANAYFSFSADRKTIYWYNITSAGEQLNTSSNTYEYIAIG